MVTLWTLSSLLCGALLTCSSGERVTYDAQLSLASRRALLQQGLKGLQAQVKTVLLSARGDGGLDLDQNYVLNVTTKGVVDSNTTTAATSTLGADSLFTSVVYTNVACIGLAYNSSGKEVGGFLSTQADYLNTLSSSGSSFSLRRAKAVPGGNLTASDGKATAVATDPTKLYVFVIYNLGARITDVTYNYTGYPSGAPACAASGPVSSPAVAPPPASCLLCSTLTNSSNDTPVVSPAASPTTTANSTQTAQVLKVENLNSGDLILLGAFSNATCLVYAMLAQAPPAVTRNLDLTVFILDESNQEKWASQGFSAEHQDVTLSAACSQTKSQSSNCANSLNSLSPSSQYFLWGVSGFQHPNVEADPAYLAITFTAQSTGSCTNNPVITPSASTVAYDDYNGGGDYYDYSSGDYGDYGDYSQYSGDYEMPAAPPFYVGGGGAGNKEGSNGHGNASSAGNSSSPGIIAIPSQAPAGDLFLLPAGK